MKTNIDTPKMSDIAIRFNDMKNWLHMINVAENWEKRQEILDKMGERYKENKK